MATLLHQQQQKNRNSSNTQGNCIKKQLANGGGNGTGTTTVLPAVTNVVTANGQLLTTTGGNVIVPATAVTVQHQPQLQSSQHAPGTTFILTTDQNGYSVPTKLLLPHELGGIQQQQLQHQTTTTVAPGQQQQIIQLHPHQLQQVTAAATTAAITNTTGYQIVSNSHLNGPRTNPAMTKVGVGGMMMTTTNNSIALNNNNNNNNHLLSNQAKIISISNSSAGPHHQLVTAGGNFLRIVPAGSNNNATGVGTVTTSNSVVPGNHQHHQIQVMGQDGRIVTVVGGLVKKQAQSQQQQIMTAGTVTGRTVAGGGQGVVTLNQNQINLKTATFASSTLLPHQQHIIVGSAVTKPPVAVAAATTTTTAGTIILDKVTNRISAGGGAGGIVQNNNSPAVDQPRLSNASQQAGQQMPLSSGNGGKVVAGGRQGHGGLSSSTDSHTNNIFNGVAGTRGQQQQQQQNKMMVNGGGGNETHLDQNNKGSKTAESSGGGGEVAQQPRDGAAVNTEVEQAIPDASTVGGEAVVPSEMPRPEEEDDSDAPEIDIVINNVVCSFGVRCHLNLREIALNGHNVEFRRENGMVTMKLRKPYTTASIWSSGKITCTGATSEDAAKVAARRFARALQKLDFKVRLHNFRIVNVLGTCHMPWDIKIVNFSERYKKEGASYEPELHPGVTFKLKVPKATLKIFSTGSVTVTAPCVAFVQEAIEHIFPLLYDFRKERPVVEKRSEEAVAAFRDDANNLVVLEREEDEDEVVDSDDNITPDGRLKEESFWSDGDENAGRVGVTKKRRFEGKPTVASSSSGGGGAPKKFKRFAKGKPFRRRRPLGKAANDPSEDVMLVSDVEDDPEEF